MKFLRLFLETGAILVAALLFMAGITGSILAFYYEVDAALNPGFYRVEPAGDMLAPPVLIEKLEQARPEVMVWYQQYPRVAGETAMMTAEPKPDAKGHDPHIDSNTFYVDPYTGEIVGERFWGKCCFEPENFVNYIYEVHHSLKGGSWGGYLMALAAGILLLNCLLVLYRCAFASQPSQALFLIPAGRKPITMGISLLLLPIAVSSIAMNLPDEIFKPLVSVFSPVKASIYREYSLKQQPDFGQRVLSYDDAYRLAQQRSVEMGWPGPVAELFYSSGYNFYGMSLGYRDPEGMGNNWMYLDGVDGRLVGSRTPGQGTVGDRLFSVQLPIHSGRLAGLPTRILIALIGLMIAGLSGRYVITSIRKTRSLW